MKICPKCGLEKSADAFYKHSGRKDGLQAWCKVCHSQSNNDWYANSAHRRADIAARRKRSIAEHREAIRMYLMTHPCVDCGEDDLIVLEFDHVVGDKVDEISHMVNSQVSREKLEQEIAKCEVRCANCHRRATAKRHGSWWRAAV